MSQRPLLIVESPSKARTIEQYLGGDYEVAASVGHVKDLPSNELGVDIENDFEIQLQILPDRKKFIAESQKESQGRAPGIDRYRSGPGRGSHCRPPGQ